MSLAPPGTFLFLGLCSCPGLLVAWTPHAAPLGHSGGDAETGQDKAHDHEPQGEQTYQGQQLLHRTSQCGSNLERKRLVSIIRYGDGLCTTLRPDLVEPRSLNSKARTFLDYGIIGASLPVRRPEG